MYYALIPIGVIVLVILVYVFFIRPHQIKRIVNEKVDSYFTKKGFGEEKTISICDRVYKKDDQKIYLKYVLIPSNSQITINCKEIWRLSWGGNPEKKGRAYPNNRYLKEVESFAKASIDGKKIFIIYYTTEHILRYINECELETIDISKKTYDYKIICFNRFDEEMDYCINN